MMEKKSANGFQTKPDEGGVQRKQLPYSVETPYGFHLDLDFLKYVDDIEKGNTIKRVHIHRRVKGPAKFSTLPRNFSLPGHGVRPNLKEKESAWSGTSTLGPKPKSRVTEVQQIYDFRKGEGGTSVQSGRGGTTGHGFVPAKPKDELFPSAQGVENPNAGIQNRPNLLRASSMPVALQQRKGSDSSSPECTVGTPENGSTENMFRPSPDIMERRCLPQDRAGLHQQITVALKRVRELEEQVKTIPELKAQILSLREEREKLLLQLKAQMSASTSTSLAAKQTREEPPDETTSESLRGSGTPQSHNVEQQKQGLEDVEHKVTQGIQGERIKATDTTPVDESNTKDSNTVNEGNVTNSDGTQKLQEKLMQLETKLTQASQELERTNSLLNQQIQENKVKEEKILQLSEGMRVEICTSPSQGQPRRESVDAGTLTKRIDCTNRETETELPCTIDQGTDTDRICVEVCVPKPRAESIDQGGATTKVDTREQATEGTAAGAAAVSPPRPRANSMERGTVTETIITQDQMTDTPVTERINQVTETEGEIVTDHPQRARASSVDRGTETERVGTVDRVTETEVAQRSDQQTETEIERRSNNNPEADMAIHAANAAVGGDEVAEVERRNQTSDGENESVAAETSVEQPITAVTSKVDEVSVGDSKDIQSPGSVAVSLTAVSSTNEESKVQEIPQSAEKTTPKIKEVIQPPAKEKVDTDKAAADSSDVRSVVPVRPQRGRKASTEQPGPQIQAVSKEVLKDLSKPSADQTNTKPQTQLKDQSPDHPVEPPVKSQTPSSSQVSSQSPKLTEESKEKVSKAQPKVVAQKSVPESQNRPKSIHTQPQSQAPVSRRDSKELKQRGSGASHPSSRASAEAKTLPSRQASDAAPQGSRQSSAESQTLPKGSAEAKSLRRGSSEAAQRRSSAEAQSHRRGSNEAQAARRDSGETPSARRGSSESPTSPAALGQVVTRLTGLLGEQWAQLGSGVGAQQTAGQQESSTAQKQTQAKKAEAGKGVAAKSAGKSAPAPAAAAAVTAATGKAAGKPGPSKMSSIQSQLVSSLSVLSAFYSPAQKAAAASKQQEQGLKSIMKKNGAAEKQGNKGAKKNLKFVGVNGGYETTSSEESSGDEKSKVEVEEEDSSELEVEKEKEEAPEKPLEVQVTDAGAAAEEDGACADEKSVERGLMDPEGPHELLEGEEGGEKVDKGFIDACIYVKDRMEEVSSPDKEMRQVLVVLYQEWFKVSSQKDSQADTVRLYLRQVGLTTPTLLPYVVNLTDGNGNMALHYSVSHSNFSVVKLLLDTGLCETDNVNKAGYTPVMLAALTAAESPDDLEAVQQLLRLGDVNARSRQAGQTALMLAVSHGRVAMVKLLLGSGADVNAQDREGSTALMCASEHGHTHIVGLLLETGRCDTGLTDKKGRTALSAAEEASHQDIVELLKAGASASTSSTELL